MFSFTISPPTLASGITGEKKFFFLAFLTYGLNICVPQISNIEIITPQGADIRSWAFGR